MRKVGPSTGGFTTFVPVRRAGPSTGGVTTFVRVGRLGYRSSGEAGLSIRGITMFGPAGIAGPSSGADDFCFSGERRAIDGRGSPVCPVERVGLSTGGGTTVDPVGRAEPSTEGVTTFVLECGEPGNQQEELRLFIPMGRCGP